MRNMLQDAMVGLIGIYRSYISPFTIKSCRHHPTCSEYAEQALREFGVFKGSAKTAWRILRCNPFSRGGYDPVIRDPRDDAQGLSQK
ncbi:MAG: membrane protein insertion efficiency factor YidD [Candidatus Omnitrophica bacterium]|nr:membrane protein insertion efficiency factor YidD [Candidatus Omnitrophota bacterium]